MSYTFTASEKQQIRDALARCTGLTWNADEAEYKEVRSAGTNAVPLYTILSNLIAQKFNTPEAWNKDTWADLNSTKLWLDVAIGANGNTGMHAAFIRTYTAEQFYLRMNRHPTEDEMQKASNVVARNLANSLLNGDNSNPADPLPPWTVPRIDQIAGIDAKAIGEALYRDLLGGSDTATSRNAAWAGTLGFNLLGGSAPFETWRLTSAGDAQSELPGMHQHAQPNTMDDFKNLLFAVQSYNKALIAGYTQGGLEFITYLATVLLSRGWSLLATTMPDLMAQINIMMASGNVLGLVKDVAAGSNDISPLVNVISDVGPTKFLEMLQGAVKGRALIGTTTDANFASAAQSFFGGYSSSTLQSMGAKLMPIDAASLAALAKVHGAEGASARAALLALSVVRVDVSDAVAQEVSLMDATTGLGNISSHWIDDRAEFVASLYKKLSGLGGNVPGSQNIRFSDEDSGMEVLVGSGSAHRVQKIFGGQGNDSFHGEGFADHLYGGAGNDTLSGLGGNDRLEGNADNDTLDGGEGADTLIGGTGADHYIADNGDTILDSDGKGKVQFEEISLTGGKKLTGADVSTALGAAQWKGAGGEIYVRIGRNLFVVDKSNHALLIQNYNTDQKDLGIDLKDDKDDSGDDGIGDGIIDELPGRFRGANNAPSPLILDLDGDGVETTALVKGAYGGVHFDLDAKGLAEQTGWVGADDGLLVRDLNGDDQISSGRELFGSDTLLKSGYTAANGFEALRELDTAGGSYGNWGDGVVDSQDAGWASLRVWKDANGNGVTDAGELLTLDAAGVKSIQVAYTDHGTGVAADAQGNQHRQRGSYTTTSGTSRQMNDVWFAADTLRTVDLNPVAVRDAIAALPDQILYSWAGVQDVQPARRGASGVSVRRAQERQSSGARRQFQI